MWKTLWAKIYFLFTVVLVSYATHHIMFYRCWRCAEVVTHRWYYSTCIYNVPFVLKLLYIPLLLNLIYLNSAAGVTHVRGGWTVCIAAILSLTHANEVDTWHNAIALGYSETLHNGDDIAVSAKHDVTHAHTHIHYVRMCAHTHSLPHNYIYMSLQPCTYSHCPGIAGSSGPTTTVFSCIQISHLHVHQRFWRSLIPTVHVACQQKVMRRWLYWPAKLWKYWALHNPLKTSQCLLMISVTSYMYNYTCMDSTTEKEASNARPAASKTTKSASTIIKQTSNR